MRKWKIPSVGNLNVIKLVLRNKPRPEREICTEKLPTHKNSKIYLLQHINILYLRKFGGR